MASRLDTAVKAAHEAGAVLQRYFGRSLEYRQKADHTFVSRADEESEAVIRRVLLGEFPSDAFNGEETGVSGGGDTVWHVDPLDGTANFMNGSPHSCVSIGLQRAGAFVLGVIFNPFTAELCLAEAGGGSYCNGERLSVSSLSLERGLHMVDASFDGPRIARKLAYLTHLTAEASRVRMVGSNALQLEGVAHGHYVSSLSDAIHAYDFAAGVVLVTEAGGCCLGPDGQPPRADAEYLVAANSRAHAEQMLRFYPAHAIA